RGFDGLALACKIWAEQKPVQALMQARLGLTYLGSARPKVGPGKTLCTRARNRHASLSNLNGL
ncbi:hypothetical protein M378DRAFT_160753, partial [Amanita muscaria Koide BX008]